MSRQKMEGTTRRPPKALMLLPQHHGCDVPGYLCHAHHDHPWAHGGGTDLRTTKLYCPFHHTRVHQPGHDPIRT